MTTLVIRDKEEVPLEEKEEESQRALTFHHPNLSKILHCRQEESKKLQVPMTTIQGVNMSSPTRDLSGWTITEVTNDNGINTSSPTEPIEKRKGPTYTIRNRRVVYMVESPEGSPEMDRGAMIIQTGLSPLMQKVRLKRKHEDHSEPEGEEEGEQG